METLHGYNGFYTVQTVFSFPYKEKGYKYTYNIVFFKYILICKKKKNTYWSTEICPHYKHYMYI